MKHGFLISLLAVNIFAKSNFDSSDFITPQINRINQAIDASHFYKIRLPQLDNQPVVLKTNLVANGCLLGMARNVYGREKYQVNEEDKVKIRDLFPQFTSEGPIDFTDEIEFELVDKDDSTIEYEVHLFDKTHNRTLIQSYKQKRLAIKNLQYFEQLYDLCHQLPAPKKAKKNPHRPKGKIKFPKRGFQLGVYATHKNHKSHPMEGMPLNGPESFQLRYWITKNASKFIYIQNLTFLGDEVGMSLGELLIEKRRKEGTDVKILSDNVANFTNFSGGKDNRTNMIRMFHNMMAAGIPVYGYNCDMTKFVIAQLKKMVNLKRISVIKNRSHEKFWIVDGKEAIMGGMNTTNAYFDVAGNTVDSWRDQDIYIRDRQLLKDLINIAKSNHRNFEINYPKKLECLNPHQPGTKEFEEFFEENREEYVDKLDNEKHEVAEKNVEVLINKMDQMKTFPFELKNITQARVVHNRPKLKEKFIEDAYIDLIKSAKKEIIFLHSYFMPPKRLEDALLDAAKRGVKVRIILNHLSVNDLKATTGVVRRRYKNYLDINLNSPGSLKIYEWTGAERDNQEDRTFGMIHAKMAIFDSTIGLIGSYNMDSSSAKGNSEIVLVFESPEIVSKLRSEVKSQKHLTIPITYTMALKYSKMRGIRKWLSLPKKIYEDKMGEII